MNYKFYAVFLLFQMCLFAQTPVWTTFYNGPLNGHDQANGVFFDNNGNIYIAGEEFGAASGGNFSTVKINPTGNVVWSSTINGPHNGTDAAYGVCVDNVGNVYSTGTVQWSLNYFKIQTVKYSPSGSVIWKAVFDSSGNSDGDANAITLDADGNIFITGSQALANGDYDLITIKMDSAGNVLNTSSIGQLTNQWDSGTHILTDNNGNVYVAGNSYRNNSVGREVVVIKYNNSFDTSWVAHINGSDNTLNEFAEGIALDDSGNVHVLCQLQNTNGGADFGIIKLNSSGSVVWRVDYNEVGQEPDNPASISVDDQGNVFVTGRVRRSITGTPFDIITIKYNNSGFQQWKSYYDGPNNEDDSPVSLSLDQSGNVFICGASNRTGSYY
ncbi:MAG: SBBP repeat-containing protein [Ignavibacteria bacterium]|nr:SBBP repeat-containing protein [Ignavibacteria bacterium]